MNEQTSLLQSILATNHSMVESLRTIAEHLVVIREAGENTRRNVASLVNVQRAIVFNQLVLLDNEGLESAYGVEGVEDLRVIETRSFGFDDQLEESDRLADRLDASDTGVRGYNHHANPGLRGPGRHG